MSITDDVRSEARPPAPSPGSAAAAREGGGFDRTPPQDIAAEQSVIGGMLLSKDAIADVVEILKSHDFYKPVHATIFDTILDLYGRGEPADPVTVTAALSDSGDLARIGGVPYLHTVMESVPTAANAAYYARIVSERAVLRRLVEAGTKIVQLGYGAGGNGGRDVDDTVDLAQQAIYDVTERRVSEDFAVLADMLQPTLDEIEAVGATGGMMTGVPTGFSDLDRLLNGLHPGQLIIVAGRPGLGKALAVDTPIPTPDGWTTMGEIKPGDQVLGEDGRPTTVTHAFEVMHNRPCYEIEFSDGSTIIADAGHLWKVTSRARRRQVSEHTFTAQRSPVARAKVVQAHERARSRADELTSLGEAVESVGPEFRHVRTAPGYSRHALLDRLNERTARIVNAETRAHHADVLTTADIARTLRHPTDGRLNYAVGNCRALELPERDDLPIPPYTLGAWLGDGHSDAARITSADPEMADHLRAAGVLGDKHIPLAYLRSSRAQRRALLAGLLDTDGTVTASGSVQYRSTSKRLADDVHEVVVSLGYRCTVTAKQVQGPLPQSCTAYTLNFSTADDVFRLERKRAAHVARRAAVNERRTRCRYIKDVRPVPNVPVRCITVDNADHMYLAGNMMIPTHNSTASMDFARNAAIRANCASAIFSLEMSKIEIVMRLLSAEARVPLHVLRSGQLSDDDWTKLARRMGEISEAPIFVDDTPSMNLMEIRAKARRLKQRHDLKLIVVDYLQLMTSPKRTESRQQEVADLSRGLKLLAKEVECPVIAVSQLNRGPEQRTDKRPQLSDLRESGCLTAQTRVLRADDNTEVTLGELLATGARDIPVWALGEDLRYTRRTMTHVFPSGSREVFRLTLSSGKWIDATASHPFLTVGGWRSLGELSPGTRLAAPRHIPAPDTVRPWSEAEIVSLAHELGGETVPRRETGPIGPETAGAAIPSPVFSLPKRQITLFLQHLWAVGGSVTADPGGAGGRVSLGSASRRLLEDVTRLLLRYGITGRLTAASTGRHRPRYTMDIVDRDDQRRFLNEIGVPGERGRDCESLRRALGQAARDATVDTVPEQVWTRVREVLLAQRPSPRELATAGAARTGGHPGGLARIADVLGTADLELHATNDVVWDEIVSITSLGVQEVYDATVLGTHNFVANGIATHNSIEQDADVVILLHRDDYYDKESPRAGEADFIVAKHRNGPTDTVTVAAQLHLSRFVDMAIV